MKHLTNSWNNINSSIIRNIGFVNLFKMDLKFYCMLITNYFMPQKQITINN